MMRLALEMLSACASVLAKIKATPCSRDTIMLLTALPPAPPTPKTIMRAFISRISVMLVISASRFVRQARNERIGIATYGPCDPLPLSPQLEAPVCVLLFRGCRSNDQFGHWSAENLQAAPSFPWPPWSRQSPAAAQPSADRPARAPARNLPADRPPLLQTGGSPPAIPLSLPPASQPS